MYQHQTSPTPSPLERALDQSEAVKDVVEQSSAELLVINAVLKQELAAHLQSGEVAQALEKTDALETKIHDTVEELAQVNVVLAQEIDQRAELERELDETKAALVQAKSEAA